MLWSRFLVSDLTAGQRWGWGCPDGIEFHVDFPGWPAMYGQVDLSTQHARCVPASPFPVLHIPISPSPGGLPDSQWLCVVSQLSSL